MPLPLVLGAVGAGAEIAGGVMNYIGQQQTNATNVAIANANNQWSDYEAKQQMQFQRDMSSTAHQREVADMRAAGLNPILSATGGSGASTPSGAMGSVSTARVDNPYRGLADSLASVVPSAVAVAKGVKDLDTADKQQTLMDAQALSASTAAATNVATAKKIAATMPSVEAEASVARDKADADRAESHYRRVKAGIDEKFAPLDGAIGRVVQGIDGATSAVGLGNIIKKLLGAKYNETDLLHAAGGKGVLVR